MSETDTEEWVEVNISFNVRGEIPRRLYSERNIVEQIPEMLKAEFGYDSPHDFPVAVADGTYLSKRSIAMRMDYGDEKLAHYLKFTWTWSRLPADNDA